MRRIFLTLLLCAPVVLATLVIGARPAGAQVAVATPSVEKKVSLDFTATDVRAALKQLFDGYGLSYAIAPEVSGKVTLTLHDASLRLALETILRATNAP